MRQFLQHTLAIGSVAFFGLTSSVWQTHAAAPATSTVQNALASEANGKINDRQTQLQAVLKQDPQAADANWQLGRVQWQDQWQEPNVVTQKLANDPVIVEYRRRRDAAQMTYHDQVVLADWCREKGLLDREQAHLTAVLQLCDNPDEPGLRARLGHVRFGNVWLTKKDVAERQREIERREEYRKQWMPRVRKWAKLLGSRQFEIRESARKEIRTAALPDALPALEAVLGQGDLKQGRMLVALLKDVPGKDAAASLTRLAVLSPWDQVRKEAGLALKNHLPEAFVPGLLATMQMPTEARFQVLVNRAGVHTIFSMSQESATRKRTATLRSTRIIRGNAQGGEQLWTAGIDANRQLGRSFNQNATRAQQTATRLVSEVERRNAPVEAWNERACAALSAGTGMNLPARPQPWWDWWQVYNQLATQEKEQEFYAAYEFSIENVPVGSSIELEDRPQPPRQSRCECLVVGTLICTDRGMVAIENVQMGDLVLSRHPETGELKYLPVLETTQREPEPTFVMETSAGSIRGTGGHTFWVSGLGWRKLRDLKAGQILHAASEPVRIASVKPEAPAVTYNLVIADFHTYFVGNGCVLSHDVTFAQPVDTRVPGLEP